MRFFKKIFTSNEPLPFIECPRCLGKGHVDWEDIRRLKKELIWIPGTCAYCNGNGKVDPRVIENVPGNAGFLVIDLPERERKKILNGHSDALERGRQFEENAAHFINQIIHLHFEAGLQPLEIAHFYLMEREGTETHEAEKQDLIDYVEKVIKYKKENG